LHHGAAARTAPQNRNATRFARRDVYFRRHLIRIAPSSNASSHARFSAAKGSVRSSNFILQLFDFAGVECTVPV
jgi:hypothetical protein